MCAVEATSVGEQEHQQVVVSALIMNFVPSKRPLDQELVGQGEEMWRQRENWWETFGKEPVWERLVPEGWLAEGFCRVSRDTWRKQVEIMGGRAFICELSVFFYFYMVELGLGLLRTSSK